MSYAILEVYVGSWINSDGSIRESGLGLYVNTLAGEAYSLAADGEAALLSVFARYDEN